MFPDLRAADDSLGSVPDRLEAEREVIAGSLSELDAALVRRVADEAPPDIAGAAVDRLPEVPIAPRGDEEEQLRDPTGRLAIPIWNRRLR